MEDCPTAKIPKPVLKGLHAKKTWSNLAGAIVASGIAGICMFVKNDRKKSKYRSFYSHYDANAAFERMKARGVFSSVSD